jgi:hypothetical protein
MVTEVLPGLLIVTVWSDVPLKFRVAGFAVSPTAALEL